MAVDMFLELDGIDGESKDAAYTDKIDVLAWSWGASQSGTFHSGGGGGSGKANFQDISVTKYIDSSTNALLSHVAKGTHIAKGKLIVRKAGDTPVDYLIIEMEKIMVTSYSTGGSGGEDQLTENLTLNFAKYKLGYQKQNDKGGKDGGVKESKFNIEGNKEE
ncbi:MAG: type VI secretion system tube protein Hcp [Methyloprofundus sp.]|nr:type VI secretion system tube protein Hcp [Methyloprofundus sp.]